MKTYNKQKLTKGLLLASSFLLVTAFNGCSDSNDKKAEKEKHVSSASSTPAIEVVQNSNAKEIKVQEKEKKALEVKDGKTYYYDYNIKSEYNPQDQPANQDASVRVTPRTSVDANMHVRSPYEKVEISLLVKKMSKEFIVKCSACHNDYANGIIGPSLLGKDADFIFNAIADFKSGKKANPLMSDLIKMMSDEEIQKMANEIYNFNQEITKMRNK